MNATEYSGFDLRSHLASSVNEYREKHNLTLTQFAIKADMSVKRIARLENGSYELNVTELVKIAAAIDVQASQLLRIAGL